MHVGNFEERFYLSINCNKKCIKKTKKGPFFGKKANEKKRCNTTIQGPNFILVCTYFFKCSWQFIK